ncbi:4-hydroxythreonine-4-phosphate dehydrogenase/glyoxylate reductase [Acididesulfobacillus acetoxydans]|uniref:4-hydroxythreonine-4-phosphate dehydrogenase n=1 Tax=Acididesulfobacillus acetoxydans TaxID=1561005 RepID=A0A8S0W5E1_9FIRM|nr:4-hydroxythreonine-4-phosphate dehydrogenase PdxA [Acididesulfobacillus acetoxydans]CAA7603058.1 4-hydroxythreonine-4-phosphate dehydrogenase/glyoxylate reductase [Acididesulfobacillus acetoxydans]CEJ08710.1 4-hydroxythreonine-4-phosphate dehydrogenase [Acididesulfobacillus acetoxydans]
MTRPIIGITMSEAAGIGPEILLRAIEEGSIFTYCQPLLIGDFKILDLARRRFNVNVDFNVIKHFEEAAWEDGKVDVIDLDNIPMGAFRPAEPNAVTGRAMIEYTEVAVRLCIDKKTQGAVGGPHSKKAAADAGIHFDGYPGLIARMTGAKYPFLMLVAGNLRVANVTLHVSLRDACNLISERLVLEAIKAVDEGVKMFGVVEPRIAVAGLNPHAGEDGMFGDEDERHIKPAVKAARGMGINASGPWPADSLFYNVMDGKYDAYVAMYHDQAHIPVKTLAFKKASAVAIGVPINWATVDHGCALDIAWKGIADPGVIIETIKLVSLRGGIKE